MLHATRSSRGVLSPTALRPACLSEPVCYIGRDGLAGVVRIWALRTEKSQPVSSRTVWPGEGPGLIGPP